MAKVAFLGLGVMGYPMAGHLIKAGHQLTVWNRSSDKSERWVSAYNGKAASTPANAIAGAFLLLSFYFNGSSFLGFAILAEKHDIETTAQGQKSLYYSNGLLEGTETIGFFVLLCLFPLYFAPLAWIFGTLCFATAILRIYGAQKTFTD